MVRNKTQNSPFQKSSVISKTAYRALFLLKLLIRSDLSKKEILSAFEADIILKKKFADDTVTNTINTLKLAGCIIKRPSPANNYKYSLIDHPFKIGISKEQVKKLNNLRSSTSYFYDYKSILDINSFYSKIAILTSDEDLKSMLINEAPLVNIDTDLVRRLEAQCKTKNTVTLEYISSKNGREFINFIPDKLKYENLKLYLWGYNFKYREYSYLRVDKIKDIKKISLKKEKIRIKTTTVKYKLTGNSAMMFMESDEETIIEASENMIVVEAKVKNKFNFIQRMLFFGPDCTILEPDSFKLEIIDTLNSIKKEYDNG